MVTLNRQGIWFYGLSGSGKTYASKLTSRKIQNSFIIDGDVVRELISPDLGYSMHDRGIQIKRILGISLMTLKNGYFPVASSVTMSTEIFNFCKINFIDVVEIQRAKDQLHRSRDLYKNSKNVVGKDIGLVELETFKIFNDGTRKFDQKVLSYVAKA